MLQYRYDCECSPRSVSTSNRIFCENILSDSVAGFHLTHLPPRNIKFPSISLTVVSILLSLDFGSYRSLIFIYDFRSEFILMKSIIFIRSDVFIEVVNDKTTNSKDEYVNSYCLPVMHLGCYKFVLKNKPRQ